MKITGLVLAIVIGACTSAASAGIVLTFDDLGLPDKTEITDQYARFGERSPLRLEARPG